LITLQQATKTYRLRDGAFVEALRGVDLELGQGDFLVVVGRSGSGKTTLLNLLGGLARPTAGKVLVDGADFWGMSDKAQARFRNRTMGFVFQFPSLMPALTVLENTMLPSRLLGGGDDEGRVRAMELLDTVGLADRRDSLPRQLSAGQQQRVVIARALMNRPAYLLADEPSSDLDETTEAEIMSLFRRIHAEFEVAVALVTHTRAFVGSGTRAVEMDAGRLQDIPEGSEVER
jgi:ABC-type lipoprotein export system ATPase subunit